MTLNLDNPVREFKPNYPQLRNIANRCKTEISLWGRATGKSFDIGFHSANVAHEMPRGSFVFSGLTYSYLLKYGLPPIVSTWNELGYIEGIHYILFKKPKEGFWARKPFVMPIRFDSVISWYTGAVFYLSSQDVEAPFRGPSIDGIYLDEALNIDRVKFEEQVLPTNRGNREKISHPLHHFLKISSSKPIGTNGRWLIDYGQHYVQANSKFPLLCRELVELKYKFIDEPDIAKKKQLWKQILSLRKRIEFSPIDLGKKEGRLFYNEADAFDNHFVDFAFFSDNKKRMSPVRFRVEILNESLTSVEYGFYPAFDQVKHVRYDTISYTAFDPESYRPGEYAEIESCLKDKDRVESMPLRIACDWGASITFLTVYQRIGREIRILKRFYVKHPKILDDAFTAFCNYYEAHAIKNVLFWYDHTGNKRNPNSKLSYAQQGAAIMRKRGWSVTPMTKGGAPGHEKKYILVNRVLREEDPRLPVVRINGNNCRELITSIELAPVKIGAREIEKDKSSETDENFPQEEATHGSDTFDIIINAEASIDVMPDYIPNMIVG